MSNTKKTRRNRLGAIKEGCAREVRQGRRILDGEQRGRSMEGTARRGQQGEGTRRELQGGSSKEGAAEQVLQCS